MAYKSGDQRHGCQMVEAFSFGYCKIMLLLVNEWAGQQVVGESKWGIIPRWRGAKADWG